MLLAARSPIVERFDVSQATLAQFIGFGAEVTGERLIGAGGIRG